jgi:hypothetical protein
MTLRIATLLAVLLAGSAVADDAASRARLMGSWKLADGAQDAAVWTFQEKGDNIHVTYSNGGRVVMDFECDSFGHDCATKDAGRSAKVSLWYSGAKLVEMETRGNFVLKRTFGVTGEGDTMDLELAQLAPGPKNETQHFARLAAADAAR